MSSPRQDRTRLVALAAAGVLFAAYPITRPYADETTLAGARGIASSAWIASHTFAMIGFILLAAGLPTVLALASTAKGGSTMPGGRWAAGLAAWGAALVLPYYGAEAFGLHAIARQAVSAEDPQLLTLLDTVRYQPVAIVMFGAGLVLLAAAGVVLARNLWHSGSALRWSATVLGLGLVLFLPQFFAPAPLRMTHGVLLGLGCVLVAVLAWRRVGAPRPRGTARADVSPAATPVRG